MDSVEKVNGTDVSPADTEIVFDTLSGISEEDQREISAHIDAVAQKNRIAVSPEVLAVKAAKPGFLFPLLVNAGAVLFLVCGFLVLSSFHSQSESEIQGISSSVSFTEGRLIQEIRREAFAQIQAKDQEIAYMMSRLNAIDEEISRLDSGMEAKIRTKEAELRQRMDREIEAERNRLRSLGLSEDLIAGRMRLFEAEKFSQFSADLAAYRKLVNAERIAAEANLRKLREEYQSNITNLQAERAQILEASRIQEANLHDRVDARTLELDALYEQQNPASSGSAREELRRLTEAQERSDIVEWQISGYYNTLSGQIRGGQLEEAAKTLESMREFLNTPAIQYIRIIQTRRELNMAMINALSVMIEETLEREQETASISRIVEGGFTAGEIRRLTEEAERAYAAGDVEAAEAMYQEALEYVPGLRRLQDYFTVPQGEAENNALVQGEDFYRRGNYQEALNSYTAALAYLPLYRTQGGRIREHIQHAGYELSLAEENRQDAQAAAPLLRQGDDYYSGGQYRAAAMSYISLLEQHPRSSQAPAALDGLKRTLEAQNAAVVSTAPAAAAASAGENAGDAALRAQNEALTRTIAELRQAHAEELRLRETQIRSEYRGQTPATVTVPDVNYTRIVNLYQNYARRDDAAINRAGGEVSGIVEAKTILNEFFAAEPVQTAFPGLADRIGRYDRAFFAAGRDEALMKAADFALRLSTRRTREEMDQYLSAEIGRNSGNPWMRDYLETLRALVK
jgi:hypothetical protein